ncbi:MAG: CCA tRNA nucleotidyltransferase [Holosporales bacterium]|jgi:tRNA nucleotidyltransferase/poly(A) polymerase|nr:CCA tRNA nucleotidyltransferase [Holosporales bacterium]
MTLNRAEVCTFGVASCLWGCLQAFSIDSRRCCDLQKLERFVGEGKTLPGEHEASPSNVPGVPLSDDIKLASADIRFKASRILDILAANEYEGRLVGGCVRDTILGKPIADIDIAVNAPPEKVKEIFEKAGKEVISSGIEHGTITVIENGTPFELTSLRKDVETDGRHAKVKYTDDWKQDAARRDFTINALYLDRDGNIYDYFGGIHDLKHGIVRFVGDPVQRIKEDYLRILRYYRFLIRLGREVDEGSAQAVRAHVACVEKLSMERVQSELLKILAEPHSVDVLRMMGEVFLVIFGKKPDFDYAKNLILDTGYEFTPLLRLFALYPCDSGVFKRKLKLSKKQLGYIEAMSAVKDTCLSNANLFKVRYKHGDGVARGWVYLRLAKGDVCSSLGDWNGNADGLASIFSVPFPKFPLSGQDLIRAGFKPGPKFGAILTQCKKWWCENEGRPNLEECLSWCEEYVNRGT